jgi:hypothetical protein
MRDTQWAVLKWSSLGVSIGSILLAVGLMWINSGTVIEEQASSEPQEAGGQPQAKVEKPLIVERKGERIIWRLQAESAKQQEQGMHLIEPRLELFTESGDMIPVQGREAWFEPLRRNIRFQGAVQASYRDWQLQSEQLRYESSRDELVVPGKFSLVKPNTTLKGRGLRVDRKSERLKVEHDVRLEDRSERMFGGSL